MRSPIEERLAAALEARAELVRPEQLRPLTVPETQPRPRHRGRTAAVGLLAAAATLAAVATPWLLGDDGPSGTGPAGPGAPSPTVSQTPTPSPSSSGALVDEVTADVDGDGVADRVHVLLEGADLEEPAAGVVEVLLGNGERLTAAVPFGYAPEVLSPADLGGTGREQVLLSHTAGGDAATLLVYSWVEGRLLRLEAPRRPPLLLELDGQGRVADHYVDDGLFSWMRKEPVDPSGGAVFRVDVWAWSTEGDRLVPTEAGTACVDVTSEARPEPC